MKNSLVLVDNSTAILVEPDKQSLVYEVCKHFAPRWKSQVEEAVSKGEEPKVSATIALMMKKLSVDCDIVDSALNVSVMNADAENPKEASAQTTPAAPPATAAQELKSTAKTAETRDAKAGAQSPLNGSVFDDPEGK